MQKITLTTILFLLFINSFSQSKLSYSIETDELDQNSYRKEYVYGDVGNHSETFNYYWDSGNFLWVLEEQETYTYNESNKVIEVYYKYCSDFSSNVGCEEDKTVYIYTTDGNLMSETYYDLENGVWVNDGGKTYVYDGGVLISEVLNEENSSYKNEFTYNNEGKLTIVTEFELIGGVYEEDSRQNYIYDDLGNLKIIQKENYNQTTNDWDFVFNEEYEYDEQGNVIEYDDNDSIVVFSYDLDESLSDYLNPFNDKTGLDYFYEGGNLNHLAKLETENYDDTFLTTYFYESGDTASLTDFDETDIVVFPNPFSSLITVKSKDNKFLKIEIIDLKGKTILESYNSITDVANLSEGVYFIKVYNNLGSFEIKKIIKNK